MAEKQKETSGFWKTVKAGIRLTHSQDRIPPAPINEKIPFSFGQERLWQIDRMNPESVMHNLRSATRLRGPLDKDILKQSLEAIVERHEILRTTFHAGGNVTMPNAAFQHISKDIRIDFSVVDLNDTPVLLQEKVIRRIAAREAQRPFNLVTGPLMRIKLLRFWEMDWLLLKTTHHIIYDRWSDSIFMRELSAIYSAFKDGKPFPLKALPIQYKDYAYFLRQRMTEDLSTSHINYWIKHFSGDLPILQLPEDVASSDVPSCRGGSEYLFLDEILLSRLNRLSVNCGVSLYVVLFSVFKTLLFRYSGQKIMVICSPVSNRNQLETKKLIGCFNNLILIKTEMKDSLTFLEIIRRVNRSVFKAMEHHELPLQHVVNSLCIPGAVISRCMFALQNVPSQPNKIGDVALSPIDFEEGISNFDLSLSFKKADKGLTGVMRYKSDFFTKQCITEMLESLKKFMETLANFPNNTLKELPLLGNPNACKPLNKHWRRNVHSPESKMEMIVANVWKEVLGLSVVDIKTSFFDMGGRSLGMVEVCGKLQQVLNREISTVELFKYPTVKGIAEYLEQNRAKEKINIHPILKKRKIRKEAIKRQQKKVLKVKRK